MAKIRMMREDDAERVRDFWMQMSADMGTPLPEASARQILINLKLYPANQKVCCLVAEEQGSLIGFLTCSVTGHPVEPGLSGEIEELHVKPGAQRHAVLTELVKRAVIFMQAQGALSIHTRIGIGEESPEEAEQRAFWQSLHWVNDMTIFSIYGSVPGDSALQHVWDEYQSNKKG